MVPRIQEELATLQAGYGKVDHREVGGEHWFLLADYRFPPGWQIRDQPLEVGPIAFPVNASYPMGEPYGFPPVLTSKVRPPRTLARLASRRFPANGSSSLGHQMAGQPLLTRASVRT